MQSLEDILNNISDGIEPLELVDRLNISVEELITELEIDIEDLLEVDSFKERIAKRLNLFSDMYISEDEDYE